MSGPAEPPACEHAYGVLVAGVLAVASASIFIRYAQAEGWSSLAIAALRMCIAALVLGLAVARPAVRAFAGLDARRRWLVGLAGTCLALHFATWISSLAYTSVASSVALVTSHPLWIVLGSLLLFRERPGVLGLLGVGCTLSGALCIVWSDESGGIGPDPFTGNMLALAGAFAMAGYMLVGRALRAALPTLSYVWLVYAIAAVLLLPVAGLSGGLSSGGTAAGLAWIVALALLAQLVGHTALNWSLRHVSATMVSVAIVGEPVASAALAWILFGESFLPLQLAGFALILTGIVVCAAGEQRRR